MGTLLTMRRFSGYRPRLPAAREDPTHLRASTQAVTVAAATASRSARAGRQEQLACRWRLRRLLVGTVAHGSGFRAILVADTVIGDERAPYKGAIERFASALVSLGEIVARQVHRPTVTIASTALQLRRRPGSASSSAKANCSPSMQAPPSSPSTKYCAGVKPFTCAGNTPRTAVRPAKRVHMNELARDVCDDPSESTRRSGRC